MPEGKRSNRSISFRFCFILKGQQSDNKSIISFFRSIFVSFFRETFHFSVDIY